MIHLSRSIYGSPIGEIMTICRSGTLVHLDFSDCMERVGTFLQKRFGEHDLKDEPCPANISSALAAYFDGDLAALDVLVFETGGTGFEQRVWQALRTIPAGSTVAYRDIALKIGQPKAVRAVGAANGRNPIALVVPCHRVIGADGKLAGYAGGLHRKDWLLRHEGAII